VFFFGAVGEVELSEIINHLYFKNIGGFIILKQ